MSVLLLKKKKMEESTEKMLIIERMQEDIKLIQFLPHFDEVIHDGNSIELTELRLDEVFFESALLKWQNSITGEERIKRIKGGNFARLDIGIFLTLAKNPEKIPNHWKFLPDGSPRKIVFDGTILRDNKHGFAYVPYMQFVTDEWIFDTADTGDEDSAYSAVTNDFIAESIVVCLPSKIFPK